MSIKAIVGGAEKEITRIPVLGHDIETATGTNSVIFNTSSDRVIECDILGNGQQPGTPAPDNIIMPEFVGVRTGNLFDVNGKNTENGYVDHRQLNSDGSISVWGSVEISEYIPIVGGEAYSFNGIGSYNAPAYCFYDSDKQYISGDNYRGRQRITFVAPSNAKYFRFTHIKAITDAMCNLGSTLLPYEPYGYKIQFTNAGQTTPIYLGEVPTVRRIRKLVLTGEETSWYTSNGFMYNDVIQPDYLRSAAITMICSHYKAIGNVGAGSEVSNGQCALYRFASVQRLYIRDDNFTTIDSFKSYLAAQYAAGTPVIVWYVLAEPETAIVNEPLAKIGAYADELSSDDAGVSIPTAKGQNTLTVDTTLSPSQTIVKYRGMDSVYKDAWEVRDNQDRLLWYREDTLTETGVSSISFRGYGIPLKSVRIVGNGNQNETPSPDNIIMPTFCGVRTGNLAPPLTEWVDGYVSADGTIQPPDNTAQQKSSGYISVAAGEIYTFSLENGFPTGMTAPWRAIGWYAQDKTFISREDGNANGALSTSAPLNAAYCRLSYRTHGKKTNPVFNLGSTPLPYEPYGWAEEITCAGQTVPIYLGEVQTVRRIRKLVLDGTEQWLRWNTGSETYQRFFFDLSRSKAAISGLNVICTHFMTASENSRECVRFSSSEGLYTQPLFIVLKSRLVADDVESWKSYLAAQYAAGTPVIVWYVLAEPETAIVNEPLAKIGTYADELRSEDAGVSIPTARGQNTLTVDTTLSPSSISITGHIKQK